MTGVYTAQVSRGDAPDVVEIVQAAARAVTRLGCGCLRVEIDRPGGGVAAVLTGCEVAGHPADAVEVHL